ncbi:DUF4402 domain-containing protein [Aquisediminimonas sediminicola]|uniref:DUF4402 domain-containing protein n=1 Tax=Alteraquisediminimonas sediminicola TaxID=2676787 RepID=UPI001C8D542B|nr:DUF4402 domain-containing protein [Aquisediminimonas sediminicola]
MKYASHHRKLRHRHIAACVIAMFIGAMPAHATIMTSPISVGVVTPLTLTKVHDIEFGGFSAGATSGRIFINAYTDGRSSTGGVTLLGGTTSAAKFLSYGYRGQTISILRPATAITLTRVGGGATMTMDQFTLNGGALRSVKTDGVVDVRVGCRLNIAANQLGGSYAGSFTLTVEYQ